MLKAWSYSRLTVFEQCKLRAKLAFIEKIPELSRPLPPGKTEHPNDRGHRVHEAGELYVSKGIELVPELETFRSEFEQLRTLYKAGLVSLEGEWAVDREWEPVAWMSPNVWARIKLDAFVTMDPDHGVVIDYKTGKLRGNEVKHMEQGQLYQLAAFMRYPDLETVDVEFWYTDLNEITRVRYSRTQGMRHLENFTNRGDKLVTEEKFEPSPSIFACRYCPYATRDGGTGHCDRNPPPSTGVRKTFQRS